MSTEFIDYLSDAELHHKLIECGFPNTPVTETTRQLLIKKLKIYTKKEKTRLRNSNSKSNVSPKAKEARQGAPSYRLWTNSELLHAKSVISNNLATLDNKNAINTHTQPRKSYFNTSNGDSSMTNPYMVTASRMYVPPPVLASESESECEQINYSNNYRRMCGMSCPMDATKYATSSSSAHNYSDGGVVSRLLSFRDSTIQRKFRNKTAFEGSIEHKNLKLKSGKSMKFSNVMTYIKSKLEFNQIVIPYVLIGALVVFLVLISVVYMSKRNDQGIIDERTARYTYCEENFNGINLFQKREDYACIDRDSLTGALDITKEIMKLLQEQMRHTYCNSGELITQVEGADVLEHLSCFQTTMDRQTLDSAKYLIAQNPQWNLQMLDKNGLVTKQQYDITSELTFELLQPNLPMKCVLYNKIQRFFVILGTLALVSAIVGLVYAIVKYLAMRKRERQITAEQLAKDIVNDLVYRSSELENGKKPEILLCEIRDRLLPLNRRRQLLHAWHDALRMLEQDSRILFGVIMRNGEELSTISWNGSNSDVDISSKKKWHSPAFDNSNRIANPPTPCLKIRHMFDASEANHPNLKQMMINAILEKVGIKCKICDIQLDKQTCCVYLRCASDRDAGIVHNEINGWWFDKRLISIKFLRLERYLSRFPKSFSEPIQCYLSPPNLTNMDK